MNAWSMDKLLDNLECCAGVRSKLPVNKADAPKQVLLQRDGELDEEGFNNAAAAATASRPQPQEAMRAPDVCKPSTEYVTKLQGARAQEERADQKGDAAVDSAAGGEAPAMVHRLINGGKGKHRNTARCQPPIGGRPQCHAVKVTDDVHSPVHLPLQISAHGLPPVSRGRYTGKPGTRWWLRKKCSWAARLRYMRRLTKLSAAACCEHAASSHCMR